MVPPAQSLQLWKGIWATLTKKKKKQCFLGGDFLFAFPVPLSLFWGGVLSESAGVCVSGGGAGPGVDRGHVARPGLLPCSRCMSSLSRQLNTLPHLSLPSLCGPVALSVSFLFHFRFLLPPVTPFLLLWVLSAQFPQEKECAE